MVQYKSSQEKLQIKSWRAYAGGNNMFTIKYGANTEDKFNRATKIALQEGFEEDIRAYGCITIENIFEDIQEMLDADYEEYPDKNSCYMEFGYGDTVTIKIIEINQNEVKLELHY